MHFTTPSRRAFLQASAAGLASLILPTRLRARENGNHPISAERVIVMTDKGGDGWWSRWSRDRRHEDSLRASLSEPFDLYSWCGLPLGTYHVPLERLDLIFRLMRVMTDYYGVPHLFPNWATGLAKREALGSTAVGEGFALLHQFQDEGLVQLTTPPLDWWLVLFPDGIEWGAFDGEPVFGMIGHVFPPAHREMPGLKMRAWALSSYVGVELNWARLTRMDRKAAAQVVNEAIIDGERRLANLGNTKPG